MAKRKFKFRIGDWVRSDYETQMSISEQDDRFANEVQRHIYGQVVGVATRQLGKKVSGKSYEGDYDPPYLQVSGTISVYQVRQGMTNTPLLVQERHLCEATADPKGLPVRKVRSFPCSESYRKDLSEYAKAMSRVNGRFVKEKPKVAANGLTPAAHGMTER